MKRKHISLLGDDKYGHWWFEIGNSLDHGSESYGWWPVAPVGPLGAEGSTGEAAQGLVVTRPEQETSMTAISEPAGPSPRYSRSFVSYEIPFRPDGVVPFAETEGLHSYYAAWHDDAGRVVRFDKIRLVRVEKVPRAFRLGEPQEPGAVVYFAAAGGGPAGGPLGYAETEALDVLFAGEVGADRVTAEVRLLRRERAFSDAYEYWRDGTLRKRAGTVG